MISVTLSCWKLPLEEGKLCPEGRNVLRTSMILNKTVAFKWYSGGFIVSMKAHDPHTVKPAPPAQIVHTWTWWFMTSPFICCDGNAVTPTVKDLGYWSEALGFDTVHTYNTFQWVELYRVRKALFTSWPCHKLAASENRSMMCLWWMNFVKNKTHATLLLSENKQWPVLCCAMSVGQVSSSYRIIAAIK